MIIDSTLTISDLKAPLTRVFAAAAQKIHALDKAWKPADGAPVFTRSGVYTAQGWTEWTQGFQFGMPLLLFDAVGDEAMLDLGRKRTWDLMAPHVSHTGVHDHGFNNVSTYGNLRRMALEGLQEESPDALGFYELALKISGAVQAARWTRIADGTGYIYSFNGPHSLFSDTIRSCRSLAMGHQLGHVFMGEGDMRIPLLTRAIEHCRNTFKYNVWYGEDRDAYDVPGRVAHEGIFDTNNGVYRCPSTQQGYSPFSTWTRGLAWVLLGAAEFLEFLRSRPDAELEPFGGRAKLEGEYLRAATATAEFHLENSFADGVPPWDTGAPGVPWMFHGPNTPADPYNSHEPLDSSAAAIAGQGFLRLAELLGDTAAAKRYRAAGLGIAKALFSEPYLSTDPKHQGLILHAVYHRPNGWDHIPAGRTIPCGESCMWGDYHALELAVYLQRELEGRPRYTFFGGAQQTQGAVS